MLLRPFPWEVQSKNQILASFEGMALVGFMVLRRKSIALSLRKLREVPFLFYAWILTLLYVLAVPGVRELRSARARAIDRAARDVRAARARRETRGSQAPGPSVGRRGSHAARAGVASADHASTSRSRVSRAAIEQEPAADQGSHGHGGAEQRLGVERARGARRRAEPGARGSRHAGAWPSSPALAAARSVVASQPAPWWSWWSWRLRQSWWWRRGTRPLPVDTCPIGCDARVAATCTCRACSTNPWKFETTTVVTGRDGEQCDAWSSGTSADRLGVRPLRMTEHRSRGRGWERCAQAEAAGYPRAERSTRDHGAAHHFLAR